MQDLDTAEAGSQSASSDGVRGFEHKSNRAKAREGDGMWKEERKAHLSGDEGGGSADGGKGEDRAHDDDTSARAGGGRGRSERERTRMERPSSSG